MTSSTLAAATRTTTMSSPEWWTIGRWATTVTHTAVTHTTVTHATIVGAHTTIHAKWHTTRWSHEGGTSHVMWTTTHGRTSTGMKASTREHSTTSTWEVTTT